MSAGTASADACFVCGTALGRPFAALRGLPVHANRLAATREEARAAPRADVELALCGTCGKVQNVAFDPALVDYAPGYETSLFASGTFREYAAAQARRLVETLVLAGGTVLEIGCGRGEFLRLVCEVGGCRGIGLDPSREERLEETLPGGGSLLLLGATWEEAWPEHPADLVVCRHVLEHLEDPVGLLRTIREALTARPGAALHVEVPDGRWTLERGGVWDLIVEHPSLFTPRSLAFACRRAGLVPERVASTYGGQFLTLDARAPASHGRDPEAAPGEEPEDLAATVSRFARTLDEKVATWRARLDEHRTAGRRVALWGAGSKGVTLANAADPEARAIALVVDQSPHKRGRFLPGTGQPIVAPETLASSPVDVVVVPNPLYADEIRARLQSLGAHPILELA